MDILKLKEKQIDNKKLVILKYTQNFICVDCINKDVSFTIACFEDEQEAIAFFDKIIRI